jgi:protein-ribulosamine 3-kinase
MSFMTQQSNLEIADYLSFFKTQGFEQKLPAHVISLQGGSINQVYLVSHPGGKEVVKYNRSNNLPGLFEAEKNGLNALSANSFFVIPKVNAVYSFERVHLLSIEYIENSGFADVHFWEEFGKKLANMHRKTDTYFGYECDNYFAAILQDNQPSPDWVDFLILRRLEPLVRLNVDEGRISKLTIRSIENLYKKLDSIFPKEAPAFLHGDLWSGNFLKTKSSGPALIDPAVYYGHREMDLAMTLLFGGFDPAFYRSYEEHFPLEKGWKQRVSIAQLYPLLFHSYQFGGNYIKEVKDIVSVF